MNFFKFTQKFSFLKGKNPLIRRRKMFSFVLRYSLYKIVVVIIFHLQKFGSPVIHIMEEKQGEYRQQGGNDIGNNANQEVHFQRKQRIQYPKQCLHDQPHRYRNVPGILKASVSQQINRYYHSRKKNQYKNHFLVFKKGKKGFRQGFQLFRKVCRSRKKLFVLLNKAQEKI